GGEGGRVPSGVLCSPPIHFHLGGGHAVGPLGRVFVVTGAGACATYLPLRLHRVVENSRFVALEPEPGSPPPRLPYRGRWASRIARQTRSDVAGSSMCSTPSSASASTIAFNTAPSAGVVPPSPPPRKPRGWEVEGT